MHSRLLVFVGFAALTCGSANAGWIGDTLRVDFVGCTAPAICTTFDSDTLVVSGFVQYLTAPEQRVAASGTGITYSYVPEELIPLVLPPQYFLGYVITDLTRDPGIASVTHNPLSSFTVFDVAFSSNQISLNYAGMIVLPGNEIFDVTFSAEEPGVPEPGSWILVGTAAFAFPQLRKKFLRRARARK